MTSSNFVYVLFFGITYYDVINFCWCWCNRIAPYLIKSPVAPVVQNMISLITI